MDFVGFSEQRAVVSWCTRKILLCHLDTLCLVWSWNCNFECYLYKHHDSDGQKKRVNKVGGGKQGRKADTGGIQARKELNILVMYENWNLLVYAHLF